MFWFQQPRLGLRKQNLPPYPHIECIRSLLDVDSFLPSNYKIVKHGDYEFLESADGYAQMFIQGYQNPREIDSKAGFAVYFTQNHPLWVHLDAFHLWLTAIWLNLILQHGLILCSNLHGSVERRQAINHAKLYAFLRGIQQIPEGLIQKLCICVDELPFITFIDKSLRNMSANSFRSIHTGKLNKDLETSMQINKILRTRHDVTLRLKYVPNDIGVDGMYQATKMATKAGQEATRQSRIERSRKY